MTRRDAQTWVLGTIVLSLMAVLPACGATKKASAMHPQSGTPMGTRSPNAMPFSLYTHCGVDETRVGSTYFAADEPLDDGSGNPPPGWGNPTQVGTITLRSPSVAVFRDDLGHVVTFHSRPGARSFLRVCS